MTSSAASSGWFIRALLSAVFAAQTAIFAKLGQAGVDSDMAALIRTVIVFGVVGAFVYATSKWTNSFELSTRTWLFLDERSSVQDWDGILIEGAGMMELELALK